jgi:hypothetical protein
MSQKENLVEVILTSGEGRKEMRLHYSITKEAEERALELLSKEKAPISNDKRTKLYFQAMEEFPNEN